MFIIRAIGKELGKDKKERRGDYARESHEQMINICAALKKILERRNPGFNGKTD